MNGAAQRKGGYAITRYGPAGPMMLFADIVCPHRFGRAGLWLIDRTDT